MLIPGDSGNNTLVGGPDQDTIEGFGGNDTLIGNDNDDRLEGGDGNDSLSGNAGNDTLIGGLGNDFYDGGDGDDLIILSGDLATDEVVVIGGGLDTVDMSSAEASGGFATFTMDPLMFGNVVLIDGVENFASVVGNFGDGIFGMTEIVGINSYMSIDTVNSDGGVAFEGTAGEDHFMVDAGPSGWITVRPGDGIDEVQIRGEGFVRLDYSDASDGIFANLHFGVVVDATQDFSMDAITGDGRVRELRSSDFDDEIYGSNADENFILRQGNDFVAGRGGDDLVRYDRSGVDAVNVNLALGTATGTWDGETFTHTLRSIEDVRGSRDAGDTLSGSGQENRLDGRGGNDRLDGRGGDDELFGGDGNDRLIGSTGDDVLSGGAGSDRFVFRDGSGSDTITDFETTPDEDIILRGVTAIADFADLEANHLDEVMVDVDGTSILSSRIFDGADVTVTLLGITNAELEADDFLF